MNGTLPQADDLATFLKVAESSSVAEAGRQLRQPKSTISRRLSRLEETLGVRLFLRNRQQLSLTDEGRALLPHARSAVEELRSLSLTAARDQEIPSGPLRVSVPLDLAFARELWLEYAIRNPGVALEIELTNRYVDLVREGFDLGIRGGRGMDETLVARRLGFYHLEAVASPEYFAQWGALSGSGELRRHSCALLSPMLHHVERPGRPSPPHRHLVVNDQQFVLQAALKGLGIAILPSPLTEPEIKAGRLVKVLGEYDPLVVPVFAVYPDQAYLRTAVRSFMELVEGFLLPSSEA